MSRKYRQRGYQEGESERRAPRPAGTRPERDGPRGRGLGAPTETAFTCSRCGARVDGEVVIDSACQGCGSDLHTCSNCRFFDRAAVHECRAGIEERIAEKTKVNRCSLFEPRLVRGFKSERGSGSNEDPKAAFDALFDL